MGRAPRYQTLADALIESIAAGEHPVGSRLPTEVELARRYKVSRHTTREALRRLLDAGLVARRRGAGTTVIATSAAPAFSQPLGGLEDLLQYARDAQLRILRQSDVTFTSAEARAAGVPEGSRWLLIEGLRVTGANTPPVALTRILVDPAYREIGGMLDNLSQGFMELLEAKFPVRILRIEQQITATTLDTAQAKLLREPPGAPTLRTVRRYLDASAKTAILSDSLHPADRFVYAMTVKREAG